MFSALYLITRLAFQKHKMFSQRSEETDSCINSWQGRGGRGSSNYDTNNLCIICTNTQQFLDGCTPSTLNFSASNHQQKRRCFRPSKTSHRAKKKEKKKCPNPKEGTQTNNKDNLTVMFSVIFRIGQCGLSFLIWLSLSKQHYDLCLCCFVAFGYLPNAANKSGIIS